MSSYMFKKTLVAKFSFPKKVDSLTSFGSVSVWLATQWMTREKEVEVTTVSGRPVFFASSRLSWQRYVFFKSPFMLSRSPLYSDYSGVSLCLSKHSSMASKEVSASSFTVFPRAAREKRIYSRIEGAMIKHLKGKLLKN